LNTLTLNKQLCDSAERILRLKAFVMTLHKKLASLRYNYSKKTEKQKIEIAIDEYKTYEEILSSEKKLGFMRRVFETQMLNPYLVELNNLNENYDRVLEKAKLLQEKNFEMKHLLYAVNWNEMQTCIGKRINFLRELQSIIGYEEGI